MTQPAVRLTGVSRRFRRTRALDSVTLDIPENAITGLLGRNGAGKTTLMSIIAGHDRPSSGSVRVFGTDPFEDAPTMSSISFVRDNQRYPEDFTLRQAIEVAPLFHAGWDAEVAERLIEGFRLPRKTAIKKLSRGQASSLGIVLGLASRAPLTVFDEPYLGLDATARRFFYDTLMQDYLDHPRSEGRSPPPGCDSALSGRWSWPRRWSSVWESRRSCSYRRLRHSSRGGSLWAPGS